MSLTFSLPLRTSIVPAYAVGSATPTFSRASVATVVDHEGVLRYCQSGEARFWGARRVENLLRDTEDLTTGNWSGYGGGTFTVDTGVTDPLGGSTAFRVTLGTAVGVLQDSHSRYGAGNYRAGEVVVASAWLRVASGTNTVLVYSQGSDSIYSSMLVDTTWRRWCNSDAATAVGDKQPYIIFQYAGALEIWHPSLNVVTGSANVAPPEYVSVGALSAPYHGAGVDGVKYFDTANGNSVASNLVSEGTGAPIATTREGVYPGTLWQQGYLCEPQIINRVLYSEDFSNAAWVKTNVTVTANSAAAPDGATTADTLTASAGNGTVIQDLGVVASAKKTGSLWIKRKTGSGNIQLTLDGGSMWTTVSVTASWTRFELTQTLANEDFGIRIVTSGDAVYAWGGQIEQANGLSSLSWMSTYVPTTSAAVQRNDDNLTFPTTGNISLAAGTVAARVTLDGVARWSERVVELGGGDWSPLTQNGLVSIYDGVNSAFAPPSNVDIRAAAVWKVGGNKQAFGNNLQSVANAFNGTLIGATIQVNGSGTDLAGSKPIRDIRIWDKVMPVGAGGDVLDASRFRRPFMKYQGLIAVTPSDGTNQHYEGFTVSVDGNVKVTDALGATNTLLCLAGVFYPLEVTRIWSTGTTATGILGLV